MGESQSITVKSLSDILLVRMRVRQLGRALGLGTRDQACIALATSSVARMLRLGEASGGRVDINCTDEGDSASIQVVCTVNSEAKRESVPEALTDTRRMVDELTVETLASNDVRVTLVKRASWSGSYV